jgi:WD40 repeat protein
VLLSSTSTSLHPNGHSLISAGLNGQVQLWDIRKFGSKNQSRLRAPICFSQSGKSVNSAFFSPSGRYIVATTQNDTLDLYHDLHLSKSNQVAVTPNKRIPHDNHTGRWLCTFMATWHPTDDVFCVGSMRHPRVVEVFDCAGTCVQAVAALTSVASRCCFSSRAIVGGNSSGRVAVIQ